jgi:L-methionine (R)-S-oxide reductase
MTRGRNGGKGTRMETKSEARTRLGGILEEFGCQTGTVHRTAEDGRTLELVAQLGVPDFLIDKIAQIPFGKGIAGAAAESGTAVRLCNLQENLGGVAKPDARKTGVSGSLAVPVFSSENGQVIGTLGIGKVEPYDFSSEEEARLVAHARDLAGLFEGLGSGDD